MALAEELGAKSAEDVIVRLLDERWEREAIAAVDKWAEQDPDGWNAYVDQVDQDDRASAPPADGWDE